MGRDNRRYSFQMLWAWDFFRMTSYIHIQFRLADASHPHLQTLKDIMPKDVLLLKVENQAGQIMQKHKNIAPSKTPS